MDRFFHCTDIDTEANKWKTSATELLLFRRKQQSQYGDMCHLSPIRLASSREIEPTTLSTSTLVERTTMAFPGIIQLAYNRGQHSYRQPKNQTCILQVYKLQKISPKDFLS